MQNLRNNLEKREKWNFFGHILGCKFQRLFVTLQLQAALQKPLSWVMRSGM